MRSSPIIASALGGVLSLGVLLGAPAAQARVFVGVGIGVPGPVVVAPAPVVVAPPPVVYAPPPVAYAPPAGYVAPPGYVSPPVAAPAAQDCREYQSQTTIDGRPQPTTGMACRQPDGSWRIVN
jgi:hypothetical protein